MSQTLMSLTEQLGVPGRPALSTGVTVMIQPPHTHSLYFLLSFSRGSYFLAKEKKSLKVLRFLWERCLTLGREHVSHCLLPSCWVTQQAAQTLGCIREGRLQSKEQLKFRFLHATVMRPKVNFLTLCLSEFSSMKIGF